MKLRVKFNPLMFMMISILLIGCRPITSQGENNELATIEPTQRPTATTEIAESVSTASAKATSTVSSQTLPSEVTPPVITLEVTSKAASSLTPTPIATLTNEQKQERLVELMRENGGCELPCWWGIMPNVSTVEMAQNVLVVNGFQWNQDYSSGMRVANDFGVFLKLNVEESIVQSLNVRGDYLTDTEDSLAYSQAFAQGWQRNSINALLEQHGMPTRVFIFTPFRADPGTGPAYHLLLFFEDLGIEIDYTGSAEQLNGTHYRACPDLSDIWQIHLFLYQPGDVTNVIETVLPTENISYIGEANEVYELISWEQATGTALESFYESFLTEQSPCFEFETK